MSYKIVRNYYPMLSSYDQTEIISYYWKVYDANS